MVTRSLGERRSKSTQQGPMWKKAQSNRDLKLELRKRINAFFTFPQHRNEMDESYNSFVTNGLNMSAQTLIKLATENLNLKTVKLTNVKYGTLSDKVTFMTPFTEDMEKPEPIIVETDLQTQTTMENTSPTDVEETIESQEVSVPGTPSQDSVDLLQSQPESIDNTKTNDASQHDFDLFVEKVNNTIMSQMNKIESRMVNLINQVVENEYKNHFATYEEKFQADCKDVQKQIQTTYSETQAQMEKDMQEQIKSSKHDINRLIQHNIQETVISNIELLVSDTMEKKYNNLIKESTDGQTDKIKRNIEEQLKLTKTQMRTKSLQAINDVVKSTENQSKHCLQEFDIKIKGMKKDVVTDIATEVKERNTRFMQTLQQKSEDCVEVIQKKQQSSITETSNLADAIKQSNIKQLDKALEESLQDINEETAQGIQTIVENAKIIMQEQEKQIQTLQQNVKNMAQQINNLVAQPKVTPTTPNPPAAQHPSFQNANVNAPYTPPQQQHPSMNTTVATNHWRISDFHKHVKSTIDNKNQILNFYQQIYTQGPSYGIHLRKIEDLRHSQDLCPSHFTPNERNDMARTIFQKLQDGNCVSKSYTQAQNIINQSLSSSDGYTVLYQLLRFVHPRLMESQSSHKIPKMSESRDLYTYCDRLTNFILLEKINGRVYSVKEQINLYLQNLDDERYNEAKSRCFTELRQQTVPGSNTGIHPNLFLPSLPTTVMQYQDELRPVSTQNTPFINQLTPHQDYESDNLEDDTTTPILRAVSAPARQKHHGRGAYNRRNNALFQRNWRPGRNFKPVQCRGCGTWGHDDPRCQFVAKLHIATQYIQQNAQAAKAIAQEYLRTNSRKMKQSTIRTLMAYDNTVCVPAGDDILEHYDVEIDMEQVDFE